MTNDEHYIARGQFEQVDVRAVGGAVKVPALCPRLERGRGRTEWAGPELGEHTREVLQDLLEIPQSRVDELAADDLIMIHGGR